MAKTLQAALMILILATIAIVNPRLSCASMVSDPAGDYLPWAQEAGFLDIAGVETGVVGNELIITATFHNSIAGYVIRGSFQMDVDAESNTGAPRLYNDLPEAGLLPIGAEYVLDFGPPPNPPLGQARLYATNGTSDETLWTDLGLFAIVQSDYSFTISLPNTLINDDGDMDFTLIISAAFYPSLNPQDAAQLATSPPPVCGNSMIEVGEECDDGNRLNSDGCSSTCDKEMTQIATGRLMSYARLNDGTLWSWGSNFYGQLGNGTTSDAHVPGQIGSDSNWREVFGGRDHTLAIKNDGTLWAWGRNASSQLGDGTTTDRSTPIQVGTDSNWLTATGGGGHTLALKTDGTLWAWGSNASGQLGDGTTINRSLPIQIGSGSTWQAVAAGSSFSLAIKTDGTLWAWGSNSSGQLGIGTTTDSPVQVQVGTNNNWTRIEARGGRTMGMQDDGTLWGWGHNLYGQLGDGSTTNSNVPVQVGGANEWTTFSAGITHTLAIKTDGTLWAWGNNDDGSLGNGSTTNSSVPIPIGADTDWVAIAAGSNSLAVKKDNSIWAWGGNLYGQVGDGTTADRLFPVQINITDYCPADPMKTTPGVCGCGIPEDADGNGITDCLGGYTVIQLTDNAYDEGFRPPRTGFVMNSQNQAVWYGSDGSDDEIFYYDGSTVRQVTDNASVEYSPTLSENGGMVWSGIPAGETDYEIMMDMGAGPVRFTDNTVDELRVRMNGAGQLLWEERDPAVPAAGKKLMFFDGLVTQQLGTDPSATFAPAFRHQLNESGQVVWHARNGAYYDIYLYNGGVSQMLSSNPLNDMNPSLDEAGNVVWSGWDGNDYEIFLYDGVNVTQLTTNDRDDLYPDVNGQHVVWYGGADDLNNLDYEIYLYDRGTEITTQLTTNGFPDTQAVLNSSGFVTWQGFDGVDEEIFVYDGMAVRQLTDNGYDDILPGINANGYVLWRGFDGNDDEIFMARPAAPVPNGGDANGDGITDSQQDSVVSLQSVVTGDYVVADTAAVGGGAAITNVSVNNEAFYGDDPVYAMPMGVVKFDVVGLPLGGSETVRVYYYGISDLSGYEYRKFDAVTGTWYTLPGVVFGTEVIGTETVAYADLPLTDGGLGDGDGVANGVIKDPGGPALPEQPTCMDPVMGVTQGHATVQSAYDAISLGGSGILRMQAQTFAENLLLDRNVTVTLKGGYDCLFSEPAAGLTTIASPGTALTIGSGAVIIDNIILR